MKLDENLFEEIIKDIKPLLSSEVKSIIYDCCEEAYNCGQLDDQTVIYILEDLAESDLEFDKDQVEEYFYELLETKPFETEDLEEEFNPLNSNDDFKYQLLGRMKSDCEYFLGAGKRSEKHLWAPTVEEHISIMKKLYNSLSQKPEWISIEDIENYEAKMKSSSKTDLTEDAQDLTLQQFADKIKYNGASYRGARVPSAIDICINQINLPDNMRLKFFETEVINEEGIEFKYLTQLPFNNEDADKAIAEFKRAFQAMVDYYHYTKPLYIAVDIQARDGADYGHCVIDLEFNKTDNTDDTSKEELIKRRDVLEDVLQAMEARHDPDERADIQEVKNEIAEINSKLNLTENLW